jgi:hypothetical protein
MSQSADWFAARLVVDFARLLQKSSSPVLLLLQHGVVQPLDPPPTLRLRSSSPASVLVGAGAAPCGAADCRNVDRREDSYTRAYR